jgi:hypothetical protein
MNINKKTFQTHEGGKATFATPMEQLKRSVLSCLLWEDTFYEDGVSIAERISENVAKVTPEQAADVSLEAANKRYLRHAPLWIAVSMLNTDDKEMWKHSYRIIPQIINRPDSIGELLALYRMKNTKRPLTNQMKKVLGETLSKFNEYSLAKNDKNSAAYSLQDIIRLTHPTPKNPEQNELFRKIAKKELETPVTWETLLSSGQDKKETFTQLIKNKQLGGLAFLRNLRNMIQTGVEREVIECSFKKIFPYQYIAAARYAEDYKKQLETIMIKDLEEKEKLPGETILLIDKSGSMSCAVSAKSEMSCYDYAKALAILMKEITQKCVIYTFNNEIELVKESRGFELEKNMGYPDGGTYMWGSISEVKEKHPEAERIIVLTDEQTADYEIEENKKYPHQYIINLASYQNGVSYKPDWIHIDGFSQAVIDYIQEYEKQFSN